MSTATRAKEIIAKIIYITIATVTSDGKPWNTPVYSSFDTHYNFYWASWEENIHSKNIKNNPKVFLVIYDSTAPEGTGEGVYIEAMAHELTDQKEIEHAMQSYYGRKNKKPRKAEEFLGNYPRRFYKAVPQKAWMNSTGDVDGNFVDTRVEIKLT